MIPKISKWIYNWSAIPPNYPKLAKLYLMSVVNGHFQRPKLEVRQVWASNLTICRSGPTNDPVCPHRRFANGRAERAQLWHGTTWTKEFGEFTELCLTKSNSTSTWIGWAWQKSIMDYKTILSPPQFNLKICGFHMISLYISLAKTWM